MCVGCSRSTNHREMFVKCGFMDTVVGGEEADCLTSRMGTFLRGTGMTWQEYANCDQELATCETVEDSWEANVLALREEQSSVMSEDDNESESSPVMPAADYLSGL